MTARALLSAYLLIGVINVVAVATGNADAETLTKPLLMPLLFAWLIVEARRAWSRPMTLLAVGVGFAWLGDLLLMGDTDLTFALGIAGFLVTQIAYFASFRAVPGVAFRRDIVLLSVASPRGLVSRHRTLIAPFAVLYLGLMALVLPTAGRFAVPVGVYGLVICTMAVGALNLVGRMPPITAWLTFAGAMLFVASDALIALTSFGPITATAGLSALIMATYILGQGLILVSTVSGVLDNEEIRARPNRTTR